jgi:hypothetical protein
MMPNTIFLRTFSNNVTAHLISYSGIIKSQSYVEPANPGRSSIYKVINDSGPSCTLLCGVGDCWTIETGIGNNGDWLNGSWSIILKFAYNTFYLNTWKKPVTNIRDFRFHFDPNTTVITNDTSLNNAVMTSNNLSNGYIDFSGDSVTFNKSVTQSMLSMSNITLNSVFDINTRCPPELEQGQRYKFSKPIAHSWGYFKFSHSTNSALTIELYNNITTTPVYTATMSVTYTNKKAPFLFYGGDGVSSETYDIVNFPNYDNPSSTNDKMPSSLVNPRLASRGLPVQGGAYSRLFFDGILVSKNSSNLTIDNFNSISKDDWYNLASY